jgi:hypothetical protein
MPDVDDGDDPLLDPLSDLLRAIARAEAAGSVTEDGGVIVKPEHWD